MVGFSEGDFALNKQLGTSKGSLGFKADGKLYNQKTAGEDFGPKFDIKDVVGCGLLVSRRQVFFTYNGRFLNSGGFRTIDFGFGDLGDSKTKCLYPSVCLQSLNEEITANFGGANSSNPDNNFAFDLEGFRLELS